MSPRPSVSIIVACGALCFGCSASNGTGEPVVASPTAPTTSSSTHSSATSQPLAVQPLAPCRLEPVVEGGACTPGEVDYRGSFSFCYAQAAKCDASGRWVFPHGPILLVGCGINAVFFEKDSSVPEAQSMQRLIGYLARNAGRYYVVGQVANDEEASAGLDRERAEAIMAALLRAGFCQEKLVLLPAGLERGLEPGGPIRERMRPAGQLILISERTNDELRRAGILK